MEDKPLTAAEIRALIKKGVEEGLRQYDEQLTRTWASRNRRDEQRRL